MKKTYLYNFFPSKEDEEMQEAANSTVVGPRLDRTLVEIRDVYPPPEIDPRNPWQIKKTLNQYEIASGTIIVSFQDAFDHVFRYWSLYMTKHVTMFGRKILVVVWDMTNENRPRKYFGNHVFFQMTPSEHGLITCSEMMKDRNLKVDDNIGLYWDPREEAFLIKLLS